MRLLSLSKILSLRGAQRHGNPYSFCSVFLFLAEMENGLPQPLWGFAMTGFFDR